MQQVKDLRLPFLIVLISGVLASLLLPYFPVDETRYLSVAWEMRLHDSFIVPLQNGQPYSHKPPLLFWLLNLDWLLLGMNELTLRGIPVLFSLLNLSLVYRIALELWEDASVARHAALILAATFSYLLWSVLIMFDMILSFWVLLGVYGLLLAARKAGPKSWLMVGAALGGGLLTKGPVVFVYLLPAALLCRFWMPRESHSRSWYGWLALSILLGIAIILAWVIPAALTGGEAYRQAILWGQTVHRVANSFAHKRPVWWYLPWIPALLMPWALLLPAWRGCWRPRGDLGSRFLLIWIVSGLVIFSLISGKQVHYLMPLIPAFALLLARNIESLKEGALSRRWRYAAGAAYVFLGTGGLVASFLKVGRALEQVGIWQVRAFSAGIVAVGLVLVLLKGTSVPALLKHTSLASLAVFSLTCLSGGALFSRYELHPMAHEVKAKQEQGYTVLHYGKYHGQFQFLGRLNQPLLAVDSLQQIRDYAASHDKVALISYEPQRSAIATGSIFFRQPCRSRQAVLWNRAGIEDFIRLQGGITPATSMAPAAEENAAPE